MQARDIRDLERTLRDMQKEMNAGFEGIHQRQDVTNGNVLRNKDDITDIKADKKYEKVIWYGFTTAVGLIIALVSFIVFNL